MDDPKWWTARECQVFLGNCSRQKWARIRQEHPIPSQTDAKGVERFSAGAVIDIGERLGMAEAIDPNAVAMQTLRELVEILSEHLQKVQNSERLIVEMLRSENESLRTMRAAEQAAHLASLVATQEALDATAERQQLLKQAEGNELRKALALEFLMEKVAPRILEQWKTSGNLSKLTGLVEALTPEQLAMLKTVVSPEQAKALDELRGPPIESQKAEVAS